MEYDIHPNRHAVRDNTRVELPYVDTPDIAVPMLGGNAAAVQDTVVTLPQGLTEEDVTAAMSWARSEGPGTDCVRALQANLSVPESGEYDRRTIVAVYQQQVAWSGNEVDDKGQADATIYKRLGLIFYGDITNATLDDELLQTLADDYPQGVRVAVHADYSKGISGRAEFARQAERYAASYHTVGLAGNALQLDIPLTIEEVPEAITGIQAISRGLLQRYEERLGRPTTEAPGFTRIKDLAIFAHGEEYGLGLNKSNSFRDRGLHQDMAEDNPSNVGAFVDGIASALTSDVDVQLFACTAGKDDDRTAYQEWTTHDQGERLGEDSFAAELATELGEDASVWSHTTAGHTTENYAARVFGAASGPGEGGAHAFDLMYPDAFIQSELQRLYPTLAPTVRATKHDPLRELMWQHFKDCILAEHKRSTSAKRFDVKMGQEMFLNPDQASTLMQADWPTWVATKKLP